MVENIYTYLKNLFLTKILTISDNLCFKNKKTFTVKDFVKSNFNKTKFSFDKTKLLGSNIKLYNDISRLNYCVL